MTSPRSTAPHAVALGVALALPGAAWAAESFPVKPIRFISPFPPGGGNDTISRALTQVMARNIGHSIVVENRPGANTIIGMEVVAKAAPDGHTLIMTSSSLAINASLYPKLPYDSARAFAPVSLIASSTLVLSVHPSLPARSVRELIGFAQARPQELLYPVSGVGNISHLAGELFNLLAGVKLVSVPYKGSAPGVNDLLGGRLSVGFNSALSSMTHVKSARLRAIAVTGATRSTALPDLPTVAEAGVPGYDASTWYGVVAPAGTPAAVVHYLSTEFVRALNAEEVRGGLLAQGLDVLGTTPEQFAAYLRVDMTKWAKVVKAARISLE